MPYDLFYQQQARTLSHTDRPLSAKSGPPTRFSFPNNEATRAYMIPIDFFGCKREQIVTCSFEEACDRFPCTGITIPDASALTSLGEALTGTAAFSADPVPSSREPFSELSDYLHAAIRDASEEELKDAGARWAQLLPWEPLDTNPMDLAGFLLHLQSLVRGADREGNRIFLVVESGGLPSS